MALFDLHSLFTICAVVLTGAVGQELMGLNDYRGDLVWKDRGSGASSDFSSFTSIFADGRSFHVLGQNGQANYHPKVDYRIAALRASSADPEALAEPTSFTHIWNDRGSGADWDGTVVRPICPEGYVSLGDVMYRSHGSPPNHLRLSVRCVKQEYTVPCEFGNSVWADHGSGADKDVEMYAVRCTNDDYFYTNFFYASSTYDQLPTTQPYGLLSSHVHFIF